MSESFTNEQYAESLKSLVSKAATDSCYGETILSILKLADFDETTFVRTYALLKPAFGTVSKIHLADALTDFFAKTPLSEFNQHILVENYSILDEGNKIRLRASQSSNPLVDAIIPAKFKKEDKYLNLVTLLLDKEDYKEDYLKIKKIIDENINFKKMPIKVRTVSALINFLNVASDKKPSIFEKFLNDYSWAGAFILSEFNPELTGKFFNLADEKYILNAMEDEQLKFFFTKNREKIEKSMAPNISFNLPNFDNNCYIEGLINYAFKFSGKINNPEKMPLALTFLNLFKKNIFNTVSSSNLPLNLKKNINSQIDFVEFMGQVNEYAKEDKSKIMHYLNFDKEYIYKWNEQKNWMKLNKVIQNLNLKNKIKDKI